MKDKRFIVDGVEFPNEESITGDVIRNCRYYMEIEYLTLKEIHEKYGDIL